VSASAKTAAPPRATRILWAVVFWFAVITAVYGMWVSLVDDDYRRAAPLLAGAVSALALLTAMRTWWLLESLTKALEKTTAGFQEALRVTSGPVLAPESAAERLAAPGEGSGHPGPAERRSGPDAS
jgi:hypothetical protein